MRFGINPTIQTTGKSTDMAITAHDIVPDSPTNNFATWNPLYKGSNTTISNGNLNVASSSTGGRSVISTIAFDIENDNFYCELLLNSTGSTFGIIGIESPDVTNYIGYSNTSYGYSTDGGIYHNSSSTSYGATYTTTNVIGMAVGSGAITFYKNGVSQGVAVSGLSGKFYVGVGALTMDNYINFGQDPTFAGNKNTPATVNINGTNVTGPFAPSGDAAGTAGLFYYPPPAGALALCTANLPVMTPDVADDTPQDYFKCLTYSGTYSQQDIAVGFKPDLVWAKSRTQTYGHMLYDTVRGQAHLNSDTDDEEVSDTQLAFHSTDGFTVSASSGELNDTYGAPNNYIAWCWKSAGSPSATDDGTGVSGSAKLVDTSGAASSTTCKSFKDAAVTAGASNVICPSKMSINQAAGFSILQFSRIRASGQTVPHGLTSAPEFMILKEATTASTPWVVYHKNLSSAAYYLLLHDDIKEGSTNAYFNSTHPNSSVFTLGDASTLDTNVICYLWHSVEGYSKFGSYTGNGSADGPFVYCGFRPAFVMIKNTSSTGSWVIKDTSRDTYNPSGSTLLADTPDDDFGPGNTIIDILSNGWKCRSSSTYINTTNNNYIFMAFAEQPFKFSNAR
jgi:hypothetical protein